MLCSLLPRRVTVLSLCLLGITFLLAPSNVAIAQAAKGQKELSFNADVFVPVKDAAGSTGQVSGDISYYFTRRVQAGFGSTFNLSSGSNPIYNSAGVQTGTQAVLVVVSDPHVFLRYNYTRTDNPYAPYVGIEGGTSIQSNGNTTQFQDNFYIRPNAGLKYYFNKRAAFDWNVGYQAVVKDSSNGTVDFRVGISMLF